MYAPIGGARAALLGDAGSNGGGGGISGPGDISGLVGYWRFEDPHLTYSTGAEISSAEDLAGGDNDASQSSASFRPDRLDDVFGSGLDGANFDGTDQLDAAGLTVLDDITFAAIFLHDTNALAYIIGNGTTSNGDNGATLRAPSGTTNPTVQIIMGNGTTRVSATSAELATGTIRRAIGRVSRTTGVRLNVNGTKTSSATTLTGSLGTEAIQIGSVSATGLDGKIYLCTVHNRFITDQEDDDYMAWMQSVVP